MIGKPFLLKQTKFIRLLTKMPLLAKKSGVFVELVGSAPTLQASRRSPRHYVSPSPILSSRLIFCHCIRKFGELRLQLQAIAPNVSYDLPQMSFTSFAHIFVRIFVIFRVFSDDILCNKTHPDRMDFLHKVAGLFRHAIPVFQASHPVFSRIANALVLPFLMHKGCLMKRFREF